jgi:hypothetical protein
MILSVPEELACRLIGAIKGVPGGLTPDPLTGRVKGV